MARTMRAAAATAISVLTIVLPHQLHAQSSTSRAQTPDITAYLPPVTAVPWLDQKPPVKNRAPRIDAGSLTAWLWMPSKRPAWPTRQAQVTAEIDPFWM
jgi:hypothetical protein